MWKVVTRKICIRISSRICIVVSACPMSCVIWIPHSEPTYWMAYWILLTCNPPLISRICLRIMPRINHWFAHGCVYSLRNNRALINIDVVIRTLQQSIEHGVAGWWSSHNVEQHGVWACPLYIELLWELPFFTSTIWYIMLSTETL